MSYRSIAFLGFPDYVSKDYTAISSPGTVPSTLPLTNLESEEPSEVTRILSLDPTKTQINFLFGGSLVDLSGFALVNHNLTTHSQFRFVGLRDPTPTSWTYETLLPSAIAASSNVTGTTNNIDEATDSPDGLVMEPNNKTLFNTWARLRFPTPAATPDSTTSTKGGAVVIRAQIAYVGAGATSPITLPYLDVSLKEEGQPNTIPIGRRAVQVVAPGQVFVVPFSFADLVDPSGADLEVEIFFGPGTSASGSSYAQIESVRVLYDNLITSMSGYVASTDWINIEHGYEEDIPTASAHHFPAETWTLVQNLFLLIRSDQSVHGGNEPWYPGDWEFLAQYNELPSPESFVQIGGVEAGGARFLTYGMLWPDGALTSPQTIEMGGSSLIGQTYAADSFQGRVSEPLTLHVTREEVLWLQKEIGWKKGLSGAFYVALEPDLDPEWQMFTAFWATLAEDLSAPRMVGAFEPDGTMLQSIVMKLREKL